MTDIAAYKLEVYRRSEELMNRVYPALNNYPRHEKFSLVSEIKSCFYNLISNIALGDSVKSKRKNLPPGSRRKPASTEGSFLNFPSEGVISVKVSTETSMKNSAR